MLKISEEKGTEYLGFGKIFKLLRNAKVFSLDEAAEGVISATQLSKFENQHSMLNAESFFGVLSNINVDAFEFQNVYNQNRETSDVLLFDKEISAAYINRNTVKIHAMLLKVEEELSKYPNKKKLILGKIHLKAVLYTLQASEQPSSEEVHYLKNYLIKLKEWGRYDYLLFSHSLLIFDSVQSQEIAEKLVSPLHLNTQLSHNERPFLSALLNLITLFIERNQTDLAYQYIQHFEKSNISETCMYEKTLFLYDKAVLLHKHTPSAETIARMRRYVTIFEATDCLKTASGVAAEIDALEKAPDEAKLH